MLLWLVFAWADGRLQFSDVEVKRSLAAVLENWSCLCWTSQVLPIFLNKTFLNELLLAVGALLIIPCKVPNNIRCHFLWSFDTTKTQHCEGLTMSLAAELLWDYFTHDGFTQNILKAVGAKVFQLPSSGGTINGMHASLWKRPPVVVDVNDIHEYSWHHLYDCMKRSNGVLRTLPVINLIPSWHWISWCFKPHAGFQS